MPSAVPKNPVGSYQLWTDCIEGLICDLAKGSRTPCICRRSLPGYRHQYRQALSNAIQAKPKEANPNSASLPIGKHIMRTVTAAVERSGSRAESCCDSTPDPRPRHPRHGAIWLAAIAIVAVRSAPFRSQYPTAVTATPQQRQGSPQRLVAPCFD